MWHASTHPRNQRAGFTLIELLVVISIIALLIGILLPSLGQARLAAQKAKCQADARGLTVALINYAAANQNIGTPDERRPAYKRGANGTKTPTNDYDQWVTNAVNMKWEDRSLSWLSFLEGKYVETYGDDGVIESLDCPVVDDHRRQTTKQGSHYNWGTDYVINTFGMNASLERAEEPSRNVYVAEPNMDRAAVNLFVLSVEPGTFGATRDDLEQQKTGSLSFGFVDGHASRVSIPDTGETVPERTKAILLDASYPDLALSLGSPPKSIAGAYSNVMWWHKGNVRGTTSDADLTTIVQQPPNELTAARKGTPSPLK
ncbi:MAG: prepilin-type N-terminal cleavage/methylation domain-containing protein [Phycisphaeraceae bacterium]|nr:prepilin-type N-terminal cleavage/methylation domain-containing protein [Phycisphaeraceae bacterium]